MTDTLPSWPPDYPRIEHQRIERLARLRANPELIPLVREFYRTHPATFVQHYGVTVDPRSVAKGRSALVPFIPFPKQIELLDWMYARWRSGEPGVIVKSRDVGASWCAMALLATLCVFERGFAAGIVSATEVKLDRAGDPDSLMYKSREFLRHLPREFSGGYIEDKHSSHLRIVIPETGSTITGEAGDNAGRGGRKSLVICDEAAHLQRPKAVDSALAATTDSRLDLSSVNGTANSFFERATNSHIPRFDITWRDDPRRSQEWYEELCKKFDPTIIAQEWDCNFLASTERQLIETAWINSAIGAHYKLRIPATGLKVAALDVADGGADLNAFAGRHGILCQHLESWSGSGSSIFASVVRVMGLCEQYGYERYIFDVVGLGAGVAGDAEEINRQRVAESKARIHADPYSGGASPPTGKLIPGRENADAFLNMKAAAWWSLREKFRLTHRVVSEGLKEFDPDDLISLAPNLPERNRLISELSQIQWSRNAVGKLQIEKTPPGTRSPNLADALCMAFAPKTTAAALYLWEVLGDERAPEVQRAESLDALARAQFAAECDTFCNALAPSGGAHG